MNNSDPLAAPAYADTYVTAEGRTVHKICFRGGGMSATCDTAKSAEVIVSRLNGGVDAQAVLDYQAAMFSEAYRAITDDLERARTHWAKELAMANDTIDKLHKKLETKP